MTGWTREGEPINACHLPASADPREVELYRRIHARHCAWRDDPSHKVCVGKLSIDHRGVTLACPLSGDSRMTFGPAPQQATA